MLPPAYIALVLVTGKIVLLYVKIIVYDQKCIRTWQIWCPLRFSSRNQFLNLEITVALVQIFGRLDDGLEFGIAKSKYLTTPIILNLEGVFVDADSAIPTFSPS